VAQPKKPYYGSPGFHVSSAHGHTAAGTKALTSGKNRGASGRGVALFAAVVHTEDSPLEQ